MELGVSDLTKLNLEKFIFDNPSATFAYPAYAKLCAKKEILRFVTVLRGLLENTQKPHHKYYLLQALYICAKRAHHFGNAFKYLKKVKTRFNFIYLKIHMGDADTQLNLMRVFMKVKQNITF